MQILGIIFTVVPLLNNLFVQIFYIHYNEFIKSVLDKMCLVLAQKKDEFTDEKGEEDYDKFADTFLANDTDNIVDYLNKDYKNIALLFLGIFYIWGGIFAIIATLNLIYFLSRSIFNTMPIVYRIIMASFSCIGLSMIIFGLLYPREYQFTYTVLDLFLLR